MTMTDFQANIGWVRATLRDCGITGGTVSFWRGDWSYRADDGTTIDIPASAVRSRNADAVRAAVRGTTDHTFGTAAEDLGWLYEQLETHALPGRLVYLSDDRSSWRVRDAANVSDEHTIPAALVRARDAVGVRDCVKCAGCGNALTETEQRARHMLGIQYGDEYRDRSFCNTCGKKPADEYRHSVHVCDRLEGRLVCLSCGVSSEAERCGGCEPQPTTNPTNGIHEYYENGMHVRRYPNGNEVRSRGAPNQADVTFLDSGESNTLIIGEDSAPPLLTAKDWADLGRAAAIVALKTGVPAHPECTCILESLSANGPWPESEAASRVDHWGSVARGIGYGLAAVTHGYRAEGDGWVRSADVCADCGCGR